MGATIIEANDDTLVFERAFVARNENGELVPRCFFSGTACELGTKPGPLADGIVACWPLNMELYDDWPISVTIQHEESDVPDTLPRCTANPGAVAAVRNFLTLLESGDPEVGTPL